MKLPISSFTRQIRQELGYLCSGKVLKAELEIFYIYQVGNAAHPEGSDGA